MRTELSSSSRAKRRIRPLARAQLRLRRAATRLRCSMPCLGKRRGGRSQDGIQTRGGSRTGGGQGVIERRVTKRGPEGWSKEGGAGRLVGVVGGGGWCHAERIQGITRSVCLSVCQTLVTRRGGGRRCTTVPRNTLDSCRRSVRGLAGGSDTGQGLVAHLEQEPALGSLAAKVRHPAGRATQ